MDHVLVVDDDPSTVEMMEVVLSLAGHEVRSATSATEALTSLLMDRPSALVLDLMLPGMTGLELISVLRADPEMRDLPVLLFSAWAGSSVDTWSAIEAGADGFLAKPLDVDTLVAEVERLQAGGTPRPAVAGG
jgi:DNA-binding response OmpR family regulator